MNIYTEQGWLDIATLSQTDAWIIVIVGARQIGKTYGILKHLVSENRRFIYLRRTVDEVDLVTSSDDLNPFAPLAKEDIHISFKKSGKVWLFGDAESDSYDRGLMVGLSTIAKMRGFSGGAFTDVFFDEFIPEKGVVRRKSEGDALLNAYTTINGNRELEGKPPLRLWLAANAFDLNSPILKTFGLVNELEKMRRQKKEVKLLDGGCLLVRPLSEAVTTAHKGTAMNAFISKLPAASAYLDTAVNNAFAYDDNACVKPRSIAGHSPVCSADGMFIYTNGSSLYVSRSAHNGRRFGSTAADRARCQITYPFIRTLFTNGKVSFSDAEILLQFKEYFSLT